MRSKAVLIMLIALQTYGVFAQNEEDSVVVPFGGNAWSSSLALHTVYFRLKHTGRIHVTTGKYNISTFLIKDTGYQTLQLMGCRSTRRRNDVYFFPFGVLSTPMIRPPYPTA